MGLNFPILASWHPDILVWFSHPVSEDFDSPSLSESIWTLDKTPGDRYTGVYQVLMPSGGLNTFLEWGGEVKLVGGSSWMGILRRGLTHGSDI